MSGPYRDPTLNELRKKYEQRIAELTEALEVYGQHDRDCIAGQSRCGEPRDGDYWTLYGYGGQARWYRRGERPECTCGLDAALRDSGTEGNLSVEEGA